MISKKLSLLHSLLLCSFLTFASSKVHAQINPDTTLGAEASRVNKNVVIKGALGDSIDGGAQRGINLFHSFSEFNVRDGQRVYFVNPSGVTNILTRVTGSNVSNILGTLGVDGAANLFLINPNGILFGKNASLDIGGSFVGTTANALQFGNQGIFSASVPESAPLLTINPTAFLFNQINPGSIVNQSQAPAGIDPGGYSTTGLRVPLGKSFVLVGGDINLDGGGIRAYSGRVELAGLIQPGSIGLNIAGDVFSLNVGSDLQLADISLNNLSEIDVGGHGGGDMVLSARNLNMDNSGLYGGILAGGVNSNTTAGDITLNVTEAITSQTSGISNYVSSNAIGKAGNININTNSLSLNGSRIITISSLNQTAVGNGGNINIFTGSLLMEDGSAIINSNFSDNGDAGNTLINSTGNISLKNASQINAATSGNGSSGNITINSGGTVFLEGRSIDGVFFDTGIFSAVELETLTIGKGKGGNININARNLFMNRAGLSSSNFGSGNGGNINVNTGAVRLDNQSTIASVTNSGNGGNIKLNATDYLLLRRNSSVQTTAGQDNKSSGNGGNVNIEAPFIIALPSEYSFIAANAFTGNGGNVLIGAQSIFGIEGRPKPTGITSEITASSQFGVQGTVGITQPEIQPIKTITSLPVQVVDATTKLYQICPRDIASKPLGQFVITGRGSLPPSPLEPLPGTSSPTLASVGEGQVTQVRQITRASSSDTPIIEAQGFVKNNDGSIELVAMAPTVTASEMSTQAQCPGVARNS